MNPEVSTITIGVPDWAWEAGRDLGPLPLPEQQVEFVLGLVARNIEDGGGPFGAAVFDAHGLLIAPGINRVVPDNAPIAHAEIVAIAAACQRLGSWDLRSAGSFSLVTSAEPCAMCLGATPWSGVSSLIIAARDEDARAVGFDEGAKPDDWLGELERRGISVTRDVCREEAAALLAGYALGGGIIYNGGT